MPSHLLRVEVSLSAVGLIAKSAFAASGRGGFALAAAATIVSISARHSFSPVARFSREPKGIWARNHGHIMAGTSELVRKCTTDFTGPDDGNRQRRFSCGSYIFHHDFSFDSFSSGQGCHDQRRARRTIAGVGRACSRVAINLCAEV